MRPGVTAYGLPVGTRGTPSGNRAATRASRRRPYGVVSALMWTLVAPTSAASAGTTSAGRPRRISRAPSYAGPRAVSASTRHRVRTGPAEASSVGSGTNTGSTRPSPEASCAAASAGRSR